MSERFGPLLHSASTLDLCADHRLFPLPSSEQLERGIRSRALRRPNAAAHDSASPATPWMAISRPHPTERSPRPREGISRRRERHAARHPRQSVAPTRVSLAPRQGRKAPARLPRADAASPVSGSPFGPGRGTEVPGVGADSRSPSSACAEPQGNLSPARAHTPGPAELLGGTFPSCDSLTRVSNRVRPRTARAGWDAASRVRSVTV